jgi:hypothetical protein
MCGVEVLGGGHIEEQLIDQQPIKTAIAVFRRVLFRKIYCTRRGKASDESIGSSPDAGVNFIRPKIKIGPAAADSIFSGNSVGAGC